VPCASGNPLFAEGSGGADGGESGPRADRSGARTGLEVTGCAKKKLSALHGRILRPLAGEPSGP